MGVTIALHLGHIIKYTDTWYDTKWIGVNIYLKGTSQGNCMLYSNDQAKWNVGKDSNVFLRYIILIPQMTQNR